jgi:hypothetical protein
VEIGRGGHLHISTISKEEPMKYDFDQVLTGLDGKEIRLMTSMKLDENGQPETSPLTLGMAGTEALMNAVPDDEKELTKDAFMKRFRLAQRISAGGKQDIDADEVSTITKRLPVRWKSAPLFACVAIAALDTPLPAGKAK